MRDAHDKAVFDIVSKAKQKNAVALPFALELENAPDAFLYAAKAYLRDLLKLLNLFYGAHFEEASSWLAGSNKAPPQFSGQKAAGENWRPLVGLVATAIFMN